MDGIGSLNSDVSATLISSAKLDGEGSFTAETGSVSQNAICDISGTGSVNADCLVYKPTLASLAGFGSLTADTSLILSARSNLTGVGSFAADIAAQNVAINAAIHGVGSVNAPTLAIVVSNVNIDGAGSFGPYANVIGQTSAQINGLENLIANGTFFERDHGETPHSVLHIPPARRRPIGRPADARLVSSGANVRMGEGVARARLIDGGANSRADDRGARKRDPV